ncbi:interleukin-1 beta [Cheilinus undulatus]|uniref:interleukin-1 beta n=1 Tax=Cheilinus undulatus TaxID=241271 RepID=UPI001BD26BB4|nr:interleukin-1 beta [Cheilinus undulatus]
MSDFDLADALEGPLPTPASVSCEPMGVHAPQFGNHWMSAAVLSDNISEPSCSNMKDDQIQIVKLEEGIELVVSHKPRSLHHVGKLVLAVNKMKKPLMSRDGRELRGRELCSAILENVVEERIVKMTSSPCMAARTFHRSGSETQFTLSDVNQRSIVLETPGMKLQAVILKGGYESCKVNFKLSKFFTVPAGNGQPVLLSINSYHLSSSMKEDRAELCLEQCCEEHLRSIHSDTTLHRFLFNKRKEGSDMITFESVCCPGWFISTSPNDEQPLGMCRADAQPLRNFRIN